MNKNEIIKALNNMKEKSAWGKSLLIYAEEILENVEDDQEITREKLLNGAKDWKEYSWGGSSLIYDCDIAERVCNPSELKRTKGGELQPNRQEQWLDVQARALSQACGTVLRLARKEVR